MSLWSELREARAPFRQPARWIDIGPQQTAQQRSHIAHTQWRRPQRISELLCNICTYIAGDGKDPYNHHIYANLKRRARALRSWLSNTNNLNAHTPNRIGDNQKKGGGSVFSNEYNVKCIAWWCVRLSRQCPFADEVSQESWSVFAYRVVFVRGIFSRTEHIVKTH